MGYIKKHGLIALKNYKYKSGGYSWLDNKMNPFWLWSVNFLPMWMAPNLVTLIGFFFMLSCEAIFLTYDVDFKQEVPAWAFYWCAFAHFVYQTLDAIDGKQARRTGASSPLGQLFDHGCDTFSMIIIVSAVARALKLDSENAMVFLILCQSCFSFANWKEYHTGILLTNLWGIFGVTEVQDLCTFLYLLAAIFGQDFFTQPLSGMLPSKIFGALQASITFDKDISLGNSFLSSIVIFVPIGQVIVFLETIYKANHRLYALAQLIPMFSIMFFETLWINTKFFQQYAAFVMILFGFTFCSVQVKLILCSTAGEQRFKILHYPVLLLGVLTLHFKLFEDTFPHYNFHIFVVSMVLIILYQIVFLIGVINQITQCLGIYCLSLKKRSDPEKIVQRNTGTHLD